MEFNRSDTRTNAPPCPRNQAARATPEDLMDHHGKTAEKDFAPPASFAPDKSLPSQPLQRPPHRSAAYMQLCAEFMLARQPTAPSARLNFLTHDCRRLRHERAFLQQPLHV